MSENKNGDGGPSRKRKAFEDVQLLCDEFSLEMSEVDREFMEAFPRANFDATRFFDIVQKHQEYQKDIDIVAGKESNKKSDAWSHFGRLTYKGKSLPVMTAKERIFFFIQCWQEKHKLF
jgi:hypothetical protein